MNVLILIILTIVTGLMIGPAIRHDQDLPIQVTGKARK